MKKPLILIGLILILAGGYAYWSNREHALAPTDAGSQDVTLTGMVTCLTMKGPSPLDTAECKHALRTDDGTFYALDFNFLPESASRPSISSRITARGIVTPAEALNSDQWQKYDMKGIFSVKEIVKQQVLQ